MNDALEQEIRYRLLTIIAKDKDLTQRQIAKKMGISLGKANYAISEAVKRGMVKIRRASHSRNKLGYVYILTPKGLEEKASVTVRFLKHKLCEYDEIKRQIADLTAELEAMGLDRVEGLKTESSTD